MDEDSYVFACAAIVMIVVWVNYIGSFQVITVKRLPTIPE
jgi:hypothetical protein